MPVIFTRTFVVTQRKGPGKLYVLARSLAQLNDLTRVALPRIMTLLRHLLSFRHYAI